MSFKPLLKRIYDDVEEGSRGGEIRVVDKTVLLSDVLECLKEFLEIMDYDIRQLRRKERLRLYLYEFSDLMNKRFKECFGEVK